MKLRNKKTGYVATADRVWVNAINETIVVDVDGELYYYHTLDALKNDWEDYEEPKPKSFWTINTTFDCAEPIVSVLKIDEMYWNDEDAKSIGNFFTTKEEAEKAVEKLKAWKRLKDKGFRFYGWNKGSLPKNKPNTVEFACDDTRMWSWEDIQDDLDLLFGGEE